MPVGEAPSENADWSAFDYDSVDDLNRLPFHKLPNVDYIAEFDESVDSTSSKKQLVKQKML